MLEGIVVYPKGDKWYWRLVEDGELVNGSGNRNGMKDRNRLVEKAQIEAADRQAGLHLLDAEPG